MDRAPVPHLEAPAHAAYRVSSCCAQVAGVRSAADLPLRAYSTREWSGFATQPGAGAGAGRPRRRAGFPDPGRARRWRAGWPTGIWMCASPPRSLAAQGWWCRRRPG